MRQRRHDLGRKAIFVSGVPVWREARGLAAKQPDRIRERMAADLQEQWANSLGDALRLGSGVRVLAYACKSMRYVAGYFFGRACYGEACFVGSNAPTIGHTEKLSMSGLCGREIPWLIADVE